MKYIIVDSLTNQVYSGYGCGWKFNFTDDSIAVRFSSLDSVEVHLKFLEEVTLRSLIYREVAAEY